jgi:hypothetical protein
MVEARAQGGSESMLLEGRQETDKPSELILNATVLLAGQYLISL